jgi:hypothetical protein
MWLLGDEDGGLLPGVHGMERPLGLELLGYRCETRAEHLEIEGGVGKVEWMR